jgi:hypothetical protein
LSSPCYGWEIVHLALNKNYSLTYSYNYDVIVFVLMLFIVSFLFFLCVCVCVCVFCIGKPTYRDPFTPTVGTLLTRDSYYNEKKYIKAWFISLSRFVWGISVLIVTFSYFGHIRHIIRNGRWKYWPSVGV